MKIIVDWVLDIEAYDPSAKVSWFSVDDVVFSAHSITGFGATLEHNGRHFDMAEMNKSDWEVKARKHLAKF